MATINVYLNETMSNSLKKGSESTGLSKSKLVQMAIERSLESIVKLMEVSADFEEVQA